MTGFHSYDPAVGHGLKHDPLNSIVAPRPIGWISTLAADGTRNLAPYSFFNLLNYRPPIIGFASTGYKHSTANIAATGEFVWNLATLPLLPSMNMTSAEVEASVDEFDLAELTAIASTEVAPPRVADSPVAFECRVTAQFEMTDTSGRGVGSWLTLGQAVRVHIRADLVADGVYDTPRADPIARGGGPLDYYTISDEARHRLRRPRADDIAAGTWPQ